MQYAVFKAEQWDAFGVKSVANAIRRAEASKGLPSWQAKDIKEFIATDAVHGPRLDKMQTASYCNRMAAPVGGAAYGAFCYSYGGRSLPAVATGFALGSLATYCLSSNACKWGFGLQNFDNEETFHSFYKWWAKKNGKTI